MHISKTLSYYKREDVREAIIAHAADREIAVQFDLRFGKRPEALFYPQDVLDFAVKRATSFHSSEERWSNPLNIRTGMHRKELDELRSGWDLVLDIDVQDWELAKLSTQLLIEALKRQGIDAVTCKFSGNKGFHIGVPFEAFPSSINGVPTEQLFPEVPRRISQYLLYFVGAALTEEVGDELVFSTGHCYKKEKLSRMLGKSISELTITRCANCLDILKKAEKQWDYICSSCDRRTRLSKKSDRVICPECKEVMMSFSAPDSSCSCGKPKPKKTLDIAQILQLDTLLVSSRHMFRMPYSLHEKSGLVSLPIDIDKVCVFERETAKPESITTNKRFLSRDVEQGQASKLLQDALDYTEKTGETSDTYTGTFEIPEDAIPEDAFPPCVTCMLAGLQDGKKRAMFALTNFLRCVGWGKEQINERLREWNTKNPEPLREVMLKGHLRYHTNRKQVVPPPKCKSFYQDLGVCTPDQLCARIKNPLAYAKRRASAIPKKRKTAKKKVEKKETSKTKTAEKE